MTTIDVASVKIQPDLTGFASEADAGIDRGLAGAESAIDAAIAAMEAQFAELADTIADEFGSIQISAEEAFGDMVAEVEATGASIEAEFAEVAAAITADFEEAQQAAGRNLDQMATKGEETGGKLKGVFGALAGVGSTALLAVGGGLATITALGLKSAASMEQVQVALSALTGSAAKGAAQFKSLQQFAAATPFEFKDLTTSAERFDAFSAAIGQSQQQLEPFLTTIGNLVSETGGGAQALDSITLALGQTASQGKLTLGNLDQINNALPGFSAVAAIAKVRGESTAQVMQEISAGSIDAKTGINQLLQGMGQFPGAAGAMQKQSQTLLGVFGTFSDTMSQALTGAFQPVIPAIKDSLTQLTPILGSALGELAPALGGVLASLLPVLGSLVSGLSKILTPLLTALGPAIKPLGTAFSALGDSLGLIATSLAPVLPVIGQLISALAQGLAPIISSLAPILDGLVTVVLAIFKPLLPVIIQIGQILGNVLTPILTDVADVFTKDLAPILGQLAGVIGIALLQILKALEPAFLQIWKAIEPLIPSILLLLPPLVNIVIALIPLIPLLAQLDAIAIKLIAPLIALEAKFAGWLILKIVAPLIQFLAEVLEEVVGWIVKAVTWVTKLDWGKLGKTIGGAFVDAWKAVVSFFSGLPAKIGAALAALPGVLADLAADAFRAFFFAIGFGIGLIIKEFIDFPGQVVAIFKLLWDGIVDLFTKVIPDVIAWFVKLHTDAEKIFHDMMVDLGNRIRSGVDDIVSFFEKLPGRVLTFIEGLPGTIKKAASAAASWLYDAGKNVIKGFMNGIKDSVGAAIDAVKSAFHSVVHGAESALGIKSPSVVFAEIGRQSVAGYNKGIDDNAGSTARSIGNLLSPATNAGGSSTSASMAFGPGSIVVNVNGGMSAQQAYETGSAIGQGINDQLATRDIRQQVRTM